MKQFAVKPEIFMCDTCKEFCDEYKIGKGDLILSNEYIFEPYFSQYVSGATVVYVEKYGTGEPSDEMVEAIYADIKNCYYRRVFAIGCGTGSEVTNISILELKSRHTKLGLAEPALFANAAVLIPELLQGLPFRFFATSSIDALIHAVESYLSPKANAFTRMYSTKAIHMILGGYKRIAAEGEEARMVDLKEFQLASTFAGIAFDNAGCAAVHAMSYPLGARYHVPHGESNYAIFTEVLKTYLRLAPDGRIQQLNAMLAEILACDKSAVYDELETLLNHLCPKKALHEYGVSQEELEDFTENVMTSQGRLMANNYTELDRDEVRAIYERLY